MISIFCRKRKGKEKGRKERLRKPRKKDKKSSMGYLTVFR